MKTDRSKGKERVSPARRQSKTAPAAPQGFVLIAEGKGGAGKSVVARAAAEAISSAPDTPSSNSPSSSLSPPRAAQWPVGPTGSLH